jgi:hypothetical protein
MAEQVAVVNHIIFLGEVQFFEEATSYLYTERSGCGDGPFGIHVHTRDVIPKSFGALQEEAFTTTDFEQMA